VVGLVASCAGHDGTDRGATPARDEREVVVASFDFPESRLLAEVYASALEHAGVPVRREIDLGPRELVMPALQQGRVDVVPEYLGTALDAVDPLARVDRSRTDAVHRALAHALARWKLRVLQPARAQDQNALVVTRSTARRLRLADTSDLQPFAGRLTVGGPPECSHRPACLVGLRRRYGLRFRSFVPISGAGRVRRALDDGVVDVGVMFTTDGEVASDRLVVLRDDLRLQPADNVVPVVSDDAIARYGQRLVGTLDAVSARLTTAELRFLNWRVVVAGNPPAAEARGWLRRHGLG
jgi:osmoprotectant transport system substrate-binding protein